MRKEKEILERADLGQIQFNGAMHIYGFSKSGELVDYLSIKCNPCVYRCIAWSNADESGMRIKSWRNGCVVIALLADKINQNRENKDCRFRFLQELKSNIEYIGIFNRELSTEDIAQISIEKGKYGVLTPIQFGLFCHVSKEYSVYSVFRASNKQDTGNPVMGIEIRGVDRCKYSNGVIAASKNADPMVAR